MTSSTSSRGRGWSAGGSPCRSGASRGTARSSSASPPTRAVTTSAASSRRPPTTGSPSPRTSRAGTPGLSLTSSDERRLERRPRRPQVPGADLGRGSGHPGDAQPPDRARRPPPRLQAGAGLPVRRPRPRERPPRRARARQHGPALLRGPARALRRPARPGQARARAQSRRARAALGVLGEVLGGDLLEELLELLDDLVLVDVLVLELDRALLDDRVGREDGGAGANGERDRVAGAGLDLGPVDG